MKEYRKALGKKAFQNFGSNENVFLLIMSWIISKSKNSTRNNLKIMHTSIFLSKVLGDKV